jgi:hypothetical protein
MESFGASKKCFGGLSESFGRDTEGFGGLSESFGRKKEGFGALSEGFGAVFVPLFSCGKAKSKKLILNCELSVDRKFKLESIIGFASIPPANELRASRESPLKWTQKLKSLLVLALTPYPSGR